ncbi:DEKNAAC101372 [Brettanomyces naardenensis]|uniref:DEKNAAC101372 n=1 Tax=Brettanomyces naardenensis TaxID=13370 RepID=A0A448YHR4_BRENA|nr:DEKNAAC101372 [Brettanomyces naardenensis]
MLQELVSENWHSLIRTTSIIVAAFLIFYGLIYPLLFHPLAKIPGPTICALTGYWILYKSWSEQRNHYVDDLHKRYGSIVRVGPNEVDISDSDYLKEVYVQDMDKSNFYAQFINYGSHNTFSTIDKAGHIESRKASAKFYSKSHVCSEDVQVKIRGVISKVLKVLEEQKYKPINVFILWADMAMDAITLFSFGSKYYISSMDDPFGAGRKIVLEFFVQSSSWFWTTQLPRFYDWVVPQAVDDATQRCCDWIENQFNRSLDGVGESEQSLVNTLLGGKVHSNGKKPVFDKQRAKSECFDHIAAGHATTATTLSYIYFELARHPEVQQRLIDELSQSNGGKHLSVHNLESQDYSRIEELPFMNAVIDETLRVYAAIPGQEPRLAPNTGMVWKGSKETPKCLIPGGTIITMQPWSVHRDPTVFTDPNNWNPDRWMSDNQEQLKAMHKNLIPFSAGTRMCIGMNLAICEIKLNVSSVFSRYTVRLEEGFDYDSKAFFSDMYTSFPRFGQMPIVFDSIETKQELMS